MLELDWQAHASLWPREAAAEGETPGWDLVFNVCTPETNLEADEPEEMRKQPWELAELALANVQWA